MLNWANITHVLLRYKMNEHHTDDACSTINMTTKLQISNQLTDMYQAVTRDIFFSFSVLISSLFHLNVKNYI